MKNKINLWEALRYPVQELHEIHRLKKEAGLCWIPHFDEPTGLLAPALQKATETRVATPEEIAEYKAYLQDLASRTQAAFETLRGRVIPTPNQSTPGSISFLLPNHMDYLGRPKA